MTVISFKCDRCGKPVEGVYTSEATFGFYVVDAPDGMWEHFRKGIENLVCEDCIHMMPAYRIMWGV